MLTDYRALTIARTFTEFHRWGRRVIFPSWGGVLDLVGSANVLTPDRLSTGFSTPSAGVRDTGRRSPSQAHANGRLMLLGVWILVASGVGGRSCAEDPADGAAAGQVVTLDPPEHGFFSKRLDYEGIPIKAHAEVSDEALQAARQRLALMLGNLPEVRARLQQAGAELHIIGRNQVTSDLPEHRHLKGQPFAGTQTVDERTRGLGGKLTSCGEENLLRLDRDRYRGRDICVHEFAHNIYAHGMSAEVRREFRGQYRRSLANGLWVGSYAASNDDEFFAELSMWYWGTRGDLGMPGTKPARGREGLRAYDPEACQLLDQFYSGSSPRS